jgi:hypothetical protein
MSQSNVTAVSAPVPRFREDYQKLLEEMRAIPSDELTIVNLDIPTAVTTVLGALPQIGALRAKITATMPEFDIAQFDKLEAYTMAVGYANSLYLAASQPSESIEKLADEGAASFGRWAAFEGAQGSQRLSQPRGRLAHAGGDGA